VYLRVCVFVRLKLLGCTLCLLCCSFNTLSSFQLFVRILRTCSFLLFAYVVKLIFVSPFCFSGSSKGINYVFCVSAGSKKYSANYCKKGNDLMIGRDKTLIIVS
jgi:hypothetical protein